MKKRLVNFKTNEADAKLLEKASEKFTAESGKKGMTSRTILQAVEEYVTSEPELFFCNRIAIEETEKHIETGRQLLQNVINEFQVVTNFDLTFEQLQTMLKDIIAVGSLAILKEAIPQMVTSLIKAEEQRKRPIDLITLDPAKIPDTASILDAATSVMLPSIGRQLSVPPFWQVYAINSERKITVNPVEVDKLCEGYRVYAATSEEKAKLIEVKKLCRMLDGFIKNVSSPEKIPMVCYYDRISGRFEPSEYYIKYQL